MAFCRFFFLTYLFLTTVNAMPQLSLDASIERLRNIASQQNINLSAFDRAFHFFKLNAHQIENKDYVTVIDYSRPSKEKRLFIFDLKGMKIFSLFVAHGRGSGLTHSTSFSNQPNSFKSSLGFIKTGLPYLSREVGPALRLHGLEAQNDQALQRGIVLHGAPYVGWGHIKKHGRLGRSLGCPAVETQLVNWVIERLKGGSLVYSFHS